MIIQNVLLEPNSDRICLVFKSIWICLSIELSQNHSCQKMNMAVDLLDLNKKGQLSWLSDYPILFKFKWSISFLFLKQMIFLWVYFLKFHYKLILLGHSLNKSSKISFHEIRKIGRDWIANVTKCIFGWFNWIVNLTKCVFGWFKQVDVFWRDDKKKGK